jgi:hypothetical protein
MKNVSGNQTRNPKRTKFLSFPYFPFFGVRFLVYGILLKNSDKKIKCKPCKGEGSLPINGSLKVCKVCDGTGLVPLFSEIQRVLHRFRLVPNGFSKTYSVMLRFSDVEDCIRSLEALDLSGIRASIVYPIL